MKKISLIFFFALSLFGTATYSSSEVKKVSYSHGVTDITMSDQECIEYTEKIFNESDFINIKTSAESISAVTDEGYSINAFCVSEKNVVFYYISGQSSAITKALRPVSYTHLTLPTKA